MFYGDSTLEPSAFLHTSRCDIFSTAGKNREVAGSDVHEFS